MEMRKYQYREEYDDICKYYKGRTFPCFSVKRFKKMFSSIPGGYRVIGMLSENSEGDKVILKDGEYIYYEPVKCRKLRDVIIGYIDLGDHEFLAITADKTKQHLALFLLIAALFIGLISFLLSQSGGPDIDPNVQPYSAKANMPEKTNPDSISLPGYSEVKMEAGTDMAYLALWNPEDNPCYFKYTILLEDEVLYESALIPPGQAITKVKLNRRMERGIYTVMMRVSTYDLKDYEKPLNGGEIQTKLVAIEKSKK